MSRIPVNPRAIQTSRDQEERRRAFREELPLQDTPDAANALEEDYGQVYDATEYHEGSEIEPVFGDSSLWIFEDNDVRWVNAPTHSSEEYDPITKEWHRRFDEHIEIDLGLLYDQDVERNRGTVISPHSLIAKARRNGDTALLQALAEEWLLSHTRAAQRLAKQDAQQRGYLARKVKYFAALKKRAHTMGISTSEDIREFILRYTAASHPEFLP